MNVMQSAMTRYKSLLSHIFVKSVEVPQNDDHEYKQYYGKLVDQYGDRMRVFCEAFVIEMQGERVLFTSHFYIQRTCKSFMNKKTRTHCEDEPMVLHGLLANAVRAQYECEKHYMLITPHISADNIVKYCETYGFQQFTHMARTVQDHEINRDLFLRITHPRNTFCRRVHCDKDIKTQSNIEEVLRECNFMKFSPSFAVKQEYKYPKLHRIVENSCTIVSSCDGIKIDINHKKFPTELQKDIRFEMTQINVDTFRELYKDIEEDFHQLSENSQVCKTTVGADTYDGALEFLTTQLKVDSSMSVDSRSDTMATFKKDGFKITRRIIYDEDPTLVRIQLV